MGVYDPGNIFQMDKATSKNKILFWSVRECRKESGLYRYLSVCARSHYKKKTQYQGGSLHNFTDFKSYLVRKNSIGSTVYQYGLQRKRPLCAQPIEFV